jgi:hypothetical protein
VDIARCNPSRLPMKNLAFIFVLLSICIFAKAQNANKDLIGKWYSIDGRNIALAFTSNIERKYYLKKNVKKVPIYNIEEARILVNGNLLNEQEPGGGGIDVTHKFRISNDTLVIYYRNQTIKYSFKRITDKKFQSLTRRKF